MQHDEPATKRDLGELKQELITKIDANAVKIDANGAKIEANNAKIDDVEKRLSAKIEANARKIDANGKKIEDNGAAISRVAGTVVENSEKLTQLTTKVDKLDGYFNSIMTTLDGLAADFARFDQERVATNSRFDRVESDVGKNKRDIRKIKTKLAMP